MTLSSHSARLFVIGGTFSLRSKRAFSVHGIGTVPQLPPACQNVLYRLLPLLSVSKTSRLLGVRVVPATGKPGPDCPFTVANFWPQPLRSVKKRFSTAPLGSTRK